MIDGSKEEEEGCYKLMSVVNRYGSIVNFLVTPDTYFVDHVMVAVGDKVTGFYDANAAVPLILPPQFQAIVMARDNQYKNVKVDYFDSELVSSDGNLKLIITPSTQVVLENYQPFTKTPENRNLIVVYGASTKSIPAQTVPYKVIVIC
ncbi:hypothetical protein [Romboutsia sp.]|uniref:hypothetical protein n=1 Tax=Romboutsia sp. TaxID=1965302 RepID=UPI002F3E86DD